MAAAVCRAADSTLDALAHSCTRAMGASSAVDTDDEANLESDDPVARVAAAAEAAAAAAARAHCERVARYERWMCEARALCRDARSVGGISADAAAAMGVAADARAVALAGVPRGSELRAALEWAVSVTPTSPDDDAKNGGPGWIVTYLQFSEKAGCGGGPARATALVRARDLGAESERWLLALPHVMRFCNVWPGGPYDEFASRDSADADADAELAARYALAADACAAATEALADAISNKGEAP